MEAVATCVRLTAVELVTVSAQQASGSTEVEGAEVYTLIHNMHPQKNFEYNIIVHVYIHAVYTCTYIRFNNNILHHFLHTSDINECRTDSHGCEQNCQNTKGSYQCFCNEGYALHIDQKYCISKYNAVYVTLN